MKNKYPIDIPVMRKYNNSDKTTNKLVISISYFTLLLIYGYYLVPKIDSTNMMFKDVIIKGVGVVFIVALCGIVYVFEKIDKTKAHLNTE